MTFFALALIAAFSSAHSLQAATAADLVGFWKGEGMEALFNADGTYMLGSLHGAGTGTYTADFSKTPAEVNLTEKKGDGRESKLVGIAVIDGEKLSLAFNGEKKGRPESIEKGKMSMTLKKAPVPEAKPSKPSKAPSGN